MAKFEDTRVEKEVWRKEEDDDTDSGSTCAIMAPAQNRLLYGPRLNRPLKRVERGLVMESYYEGGQDGCPMGT